MPISPLANAQTAANTEARTRLSDNYDTFLVLLTAQLQNQDPLAPMDSTQFTQQLVQFSQVEQQIRTNEQLESLVGQYQAAAAGAALSYLGREALIESNATTLTDGQASWGYTLDGPAEDVTLTVQDSRGRTIFEAPGDRSQGTHLFFWEGVDANGDPVPEGSYRLVVTAKDEAGEAVQATLTVRERILGVDFSGAAPLIITATGSRELATVRAVLDGG